MRDFYVERLATIARRRYPGYTYRVFMARRAFLNAPLEAFEIYERPEGGLVIIRVNHDTKTVWARVVDNGDWSLKQLNKNLRERLQKQLADMRIQKTMDEIFLP